MAKETFECQNDIFYFSFPSPKVNSIENFVLQMQAPLDVTECKCQIFIVYSLDILGALPNRVPEKHVYMYISLAEDTLNWNIYTTRYNIKQSRFHSKVSAIHLWS